MAASPQPQREPAALPVDPGLVVLGLISALNLVLHFGLEPNSPLQVFLLLADVLIALVFLVDFLTRFVQSAGRWSYFLKFGGWLDLLCGLPLLFAALFRFARALRDLRRLPSLPRPAFTPAHRTRAMKNLRTLVFASGLFTIALGGILLLTISQAGLDSDVETNVNTLIYKQNELAVNIDAAGRAFWRAVLFVSGVSISDPPLNSLGEKLSSIILLVLGAGALVLLFASPLRDSMRNLAAHRLFFGQGKAKNGPAGGQ